MQSLIVATLLIASVLPDSFPADAAPALTPIPSDRYLHSTSALTDANPNQVIEIHFALSPSDPAQYEVALQASSHPGSTPLTPSEAIDRFRPDTSALTSYLKSFGVNPQPQFSTALDLDFVGSISQIGRALHVHFKSIGAPGPMGDERSALPAKCDSPQRARCRRPQWDTSLSTYGDIY